MTADGFEITAEANPYIYQQAEAHFKSAMKKAEERVEYLNKLINFLEEGGFEFGKSLFGRSSHYSTEFKNERPQIESCYDHTYRVYISGGDDVVVHFDEFPSIWGESDNNFSRTRVCMLGVDLDKDALGTYCAKARMFNVDFRYDWGRYNSRTDYTRVVSESLNKNERGVKASTMYKKLLKQQDNVKAMIESSNKAQSVIGAAIEKYKGLYPDAKVYAEELYSRSRGRMQPRGKGVRIDFANGSYIEISVSNSGDERMFKYLDKRVNTLDLSDLCDHLSK